MNQENVYLNYDNSVDLLVQADGVPIDGAQVTRTVLKLTPGSPSSIDSQTAASAFDWSTGGGVLILKLGDQGLSASRYSARLIIYDASHPSGLVWGDPFNLIGKSV